MATFSVNAASLVLNMATHALQEHVFKSNAEAFLHGAGIQTAFVLIVL